MTASVLCRVWWVTYHALIRSPPVVPGRAKLKKLPAKVSLTESHSVRCTSWMRSIHTSRTAARNGTGAKIRIASRALRTSIRRTTDPSP